MKDKLISLASTYGPAITAKGHQLVSSQIPDATKIGVAWALKNPGSATLLVTGGMIVAAPVAIALPVLGAYGFTSAGVAAGSYAATAQVPNVVAGSVFALCQSAGAGGAGAAVVGAATQAGGMAVAGVGVVLAWWKK